MSRALWLSRTNPRRGTQPPAWRRLLAVGGAAALSTTALMVVSSPAQAAPGCSVTYTKSWEGGNGFGGDIKITNTGDPLTSWSLGFAFPGSQQVGNGWGARFTQSGANVTAANESYNGNLGTGATVGIGFNGTFSGTNTNPSAFTLNGTTCNGGGGNTAPTVSLTSPTAGQSFAAGAAIPLAADAADAGGSVTRVEFRVDGALVATDTTAPYTFSATGLASGSHSATATAYDNGSPALSTTSTAVAFSIGGTTQPSIVAVPTSVSLASGGTGSSSIRLSAAPASPVTVALARTGSTANSASATSVTLNSSNWQTGATVNFTTTTGTTTEVSTFTATASGYTAAAITVTRQGSTGNGRVDNPYAGSGVYVNPIWSANASSVSGGSRVANQPTAVWFDRISAITGNGSPTTGTMGLADHLDEAVEQDAANGATPTVIQVVIYNLPGRDCSALASNGELPADAIGRYRTEYIDPIAAIMRQPAYANLRIVAVIEIDSLPNLVTNTGSRPTAVANCNTMLANGNYVTGVGYALATLGAIPNVYNYVDAGHHGWIGWDDNFGATAQILHQAATASGSTVNNVHGFITNTANYSALSETFIGPVTEQLRNTTWIDWNRYNDELTFAQAFRSRLVTQGFSSNIGMLIDTSRNGWGGPNRPTGPSTSSDPNTFVNESRIDRRIHKGNWCNQSGAGLGERPRSAPASGIDAYVWIKPPGESDGSATLIPNDEGKGFDEMCSPTYGGNIRNGNNPTGALAGAPLSGHWFSAQFQQLMANAYPPL
jgi:cellulose 1,4-beta-cellobiosidase